MGQRFCEETRTACIPKRSTRLCRGISFARLVKRRRTLFLRLLISFVLRGSLACVFSDREKNENFTGSRSGLVREQASFYVTFSSRLYPRRELYSSYKWDYYMLNVIITRVLFIILFFLDELRYDYVQINNTFYILLYYTINSSLTKYRRVFLSSKPERYEVFNFRF